MPSAEPGEADDLIGSLVDGRYKVLEAMASGSMGAVYKAERVPVGKIVAIKFLHAAFANESEFIARFERETRVMSKLAHPNCVSVVDFGVFDGSPYIVMDFVNGTTLRAVVDEGPIEPIRALSLARQITAGLAHAHAQGIVHRDIKPANIMISEEIGTGDHVRILDFGLARLRGAVGRDATQSNVVVGTPNYMAPEQTVGGGTIDARTDVYAVGVVLFEMIAGERPFQAEDTLALLGMHRAAPVPKLSDRAKRGTVIPAGVQSVIEKAMAKSPDDRYQSAIDLAEAIDELAGAQGEQLSGRHRRARTDAAAAGMAPTMQVDLASSMIKLEEDRRRRKKKKSSSMLPGLILVLLLLGGGAYGAWYLKNRATGGKKGPTDAGLVATGDDRRDAGRVTNLDAREEPLNTTIDAAPAAANDAGSKAVIDAPEAPPQSIDAAVYQGSDDPTILTPNGDDEPEPTPDPAKADNPSHKETEAPDEASDAPKTANEAEKRTPAPPAVVAPTIKDAVALIQDGKSEQAIASLRAQWKKNSKSAYIPFLLGNLYFDKLWWAVAMDHYRIAIAKNAVYKQNPTLNRNIIHMLISKKTSNEADYFLRKIIGKASLPYLRQAAASDKNSYVRRYAAALVKAIGGR